MLVLTVIRPVQLYGQNTQSEGFLFSEHIKVYIACDLICIILLKMITDFLLAVLFITVPV